MLQDKVTCLTSALFLFVSLLIFLIFFYFIFSGAGWWWARLGLMGLSAVHTYFFQCRERWSQLLRIIDHRLFHWGDYK